MEAPMQSQRTPEAINADDLGADDLGVEAKSACGATYDL
jgi:hypothetical protein